MRPLREIRLFLMPHRASTQTWMMLTFTLFVGGAVVALGLYSFLVLRGQAQAAVQETMRDQARYVAIQIESSGPEQVLERLRELSSATPYRIGVATPDSMLWEVTDRAIVTDRDFLSRPEVEEALASGFGFSERVEDGDAVLYAAVYRPTSGLVVRLAQTEPPFHVVTQRLQATLAIGLALTLVLTLMGAWIAAQQVTRPLRALGESARRIAEGELDRPVRVRTRASEIQDLSKSLGGMAQRFRQDIVELQRASQVQNEFIGNIGHEVKNPIFAVGGYLEALATPHLTEEQRTKYATKGLTNLQRLNNLFTDLIEIAKLEYRHDAIMAEPFDLQELVEEVGEMLERKAEAKGLHFAYANKPLAVYADRARIRQVLTNLMDNAIAYTDEGAVRCRLRRHRDKARFEVVDTGRGIPEDHLDRIFERFYRVDMARSRAQGGTGLGLAIVKQILQAHGGTIHVESTAGRGTRFWFELPLADGAADEGDDEGELLLRAEA